jgi:hypothetical protein
MARRIPILFLLRLLKQAFDVFLYFFQEGKEYKGAVGVAGRNKLRIYTCLSVRGDGINIRVGSVSY